MRRYRGFSLRLGSTLTPEVFEKKLRNGLFDFLIVEPHRVLEMEQLQYVVFAQAGEKDRIYGVIITRDDTIPVESLSFAGTPFASAESMH